MAQITVAINGRNYAVACDDGQEDRVRRLAGYVEQKVVGLVGQLGQVGEARLILLAGLLVADELASVYEETAQLRAAKDQQSSAADQAGRLLDGVTARVDTLAARLEHA